MEETLKAIQQQLMDLASTKKEVLTRLDTLEDGQAVDDEATKGDIEKGAKFAGREPPLRDPFESSRMFSGREKALSLTFGDAGDCSPKSLKLFVDHYELASAQNAGRKIDGWENAEFRARELRLQLRGEPALWIAHESAMSAEWTKSDEKIIGMLRQRYLQTQSLELSIVMFEELRQEENESLASYMTRCQEKGMEAFVELDEPRSTQQRIVWKFLSGIKDPSIRSEVIKQKWMKNPYETKPYGEILLIAEQAKLDKLAAVATGKGLEGHKDHFKAAASRVGDRRRSMPKGRTPNHSGESSTGSTPAPSPKSGRSSLGSTGSSESGILSPVGSDSGNFLCHYCKTRSHFGGWKLCPKRSSENPSWKPQSQGFQ